MSMPNLKTLVQSTLAGCCDSVDAVIVGNGMSYNYTLSSDKTKIYNLEHVLSQLGDNERHELEDRLCVAAILDLPLPNVGYISSSRFVNGDPLYLMEANVKIPYGAILAWNGWFLSLYFKNKTPSTFTAVRGDPPFENLDMNKMTTEDEGSGDAGADGGSGSCLNGQDRTILEFVKLMLSSQRTGTNAEEDGRSESHFMGVVAKRQLLEYFERVEFPPDLLDELDAGSLNRILNEEETAGAAACKLESLFTPVDNLYLCFYLCHKFVNYVSRIKFSYSIYGMYCYLCMLNDFNLTKDFAKVTELPMEYMRHIVLERDSPYLRGKNLSYVKGSYLKKRSLYEMYMHVKNECWSDLVRTVAADKEAMSEERCDEIYTLFLKNDKPTKFYYVAFVCAMFERCRIIVAKTVHVKSEDRNEEIRLFTKLMNAFHDFIVNVTGKVGIDTKLSYGEITDFVTIHEHDITNLLSTLSRDDLLKTCTKFIREKIK